MSGSSGTLILTAPPTPAEVIVSGAYQVCGCSLETGQQIWSVDGMAWQVKTMPLIDGNHLFVHSYM